VADLLHLNLTNAILPLALLLGLCIAMPALFAGETLSHRTLALAILATAAVAWASGVAILAWLSAQVNAEIGTAWSYFRRSGLLALLWGPVLALVWLVRAQGVERRRGLLMGRGGDEAAD
jgi:uncharacterized membrane protein YbhN (UPF0104 family)